MAKLYDDTLPCLQAVGPWWDQQDRLLLFCYLKDVFDLDSDYIASLPAAKMCNADGEICLTEYDIDSEYEKYTLERKSADKNPFTCCKIRNFKFSFGKLNRRICFLCPYSRLYKNYNLYDEFRFINYLMQSKELTLSKYTGEDKNILPEIFISYFPSYVGDVLFEAFPFSYFVEAFSDLNAGDYLNEPEKTREQLVSYVRKIIENKVNYIHNKEIYFNQYPDYQNMLKNSADRAFSHIEQINFRRSINRPMIARLYSLIKNNRKYVPLEPHTYLNENSNYFDTDRFVNSVPDFYNESETEKNIPSLNESDINNETNIVVNSSSNEYEKSASSGSSSPELVSSPEAVSTVPVNLLLGLEDESLKELKDLDGDKLKGSAKDALKKETAAVILENDTTTATLEKEADNASMENSSSPKDEESISLDEIEKNLNNFVSSTECKKEPYKEFYEINSTDDIFVYGTSNEDNDQLLLNIFVDDATYLNMEPVRLGDSRGILIINPAGDKMFYSIELYGPRPIRKIADKGLPVYTSNRFYLCKYLFRSRVFKLNVKDVGIALSIQRNRAIDSISYFNDSSFPDAMYSYAELYEQALSYFSVDEKNLLYRMENLSSIICSDGLPLPFHNMKSLCKVHDSLNIEFLYRVDMLPHVPGVFVFLRASNDFFKQNTTELNRLYVDTCIELDKYVPFTSGKSYLLKLNEKGLLIYFTGNELEQSQNQLHLSSCARRCFSKACPEGTAIVIEEKTHVHKIKSNK